MSAFLSPSFLQEQQSIAVGLSGGPDSTALTHMLSDVCKTHDLPTSIHALIIDHNLRPEAAAEAQNTSDIAKSFYNVTPCILTWDQPETESRILEAARKARYELMAEYCLKHNISHLYIAHHQDDQVETFLFRLAKGSGLDGLCGMQETYSYNDSLTLLRPLLESSKQELVDYCTVHHLPYIQDPTNEKTDYARPRLRQSRAVLEQEGFSAKRLTATSKRLSRAKEAMIWLSDQAWNESVSKQQNRIEINLDTLAGYPEEIHFRIIKQAIMNLTAGRDYAPRMEKLEEMVEELFQKTTFRKQTFAHLIFEKTTRQDQSILIIETETVN